MAKDAFSASQIVPIGITTAQGCQGGGMIGVFPINQLECQDSMTIEPFIRCFEANFALHDETIKEWESQKCGSVINKTLEPTPGCKRE